MRIFISHSSKDKECYTDDVVKKLIEKLGKDAIVYDTETFEAGEKSIDEIDRTLSYTDLYVILLSVEAVESRWVKYELSEAHKKLNDRKLNRIYPIIIDQGLKYTDNRIPAWLREYNLKYIVRPAKAAKLIIERAKDVKWTRHPEFSDQQNIFVGRNELIDDFEKRIDNYDKAPLNTLIVSGIQNIGRKSLARHCLAKGTIISPHYEFPQISLTYQESIEDFILKINDFGFTEGKEILELSSKSLEEKVTCATNLAIEIIKLSEIILIKDDGCIIDYRGNISGWFKSIILSTRLSTKVLFVIVTKYRINFESIRTIECAFFLNVPELDQTERRGLLRRLAEVRELDLSRDKLELIGYYLTGYPSQVYYAIDIIKEQGYTYLSRNLKLLSEYSEQEVSFLLQKYSKDERAFQLLALINLFDAISIAMLYNILETTPDFIDLYEQLYQESFFELEGVNGEYIRLNEVVRNYISRIKVKVMPIHMKKAHELFSDMFIDDNSSWYNVNDFLLAMRENLKNGKAIPQEYVIPSVFLKSMSDLYANTQYKNVVKLAKRALENIKNNDPRIIYEIRYLLCSALAKLKNSECLEEVRFLEHDDMTFILAFYYRQIGKNDRALDRLNELLSKRPEMSKAKREKVLVLKNLQLFGEATDLAKENYYYYSDNPYHIQAYFECLINNYYQKPEDQLLKELLTKLLRIQSEKAQSMYKRCYALYLAYVEQDSAAALNKVDEAIHEFPKDRKYALSTKFDIAQLFRRKDVMERVITDLESEKSNANTVVLCKSKLLATEGNVDKAIEYFTRNITFFTDESKQAFCNKLKNYRKEYP